MNEKIDTRILEKVDPDKVENLLQPGTVLVPMSYFTRLGHSNVFVVDDEDFPDMQEFLWQGTKEFINNDGDMVEKDVLYCKRSTGEQLLQEFEG